MAQAIDIQTTAQKIRAGDRRALARAITLVESTRREDRAMAGALLAELGTDRQALRIGLSGTPGVGKSTFIESFGRMLTGQGLRPEASGDGWLRQLYRQTVRGEWL